jgi:type II secretory pathway pseudopilin PulG
MTLRIVRSSSGFTYIAALAMVVIMGIMVSQAAIYWKTAMQRERETELIFRGTQIRDALRRFYGLPSDYQIASSQLAGSTPIVAPTVIPDNAPRLNELKDLLQPPQFAGKKRFLRKLYPDPMTGKDFGVLRDANQRIVGVASTSETEPIKRAKFPFDLAPGDFEDKKKYTEWQFICVHYPLAGSAGGGITGLDGSKSPAGGPAGGTQPPGAPGGTVPQPQPPAP